MLPLHFLLLSLLLLPPGSKIQMLDLPYIVHLI
jgi:hypothetical protein